MIDKLDELNIALSSLSKLMDGNKCADRNLVIDDYRKNTKEGRMPDYDLTIDYSSHLGFIKATEEILELSADGEKYLSLNLDFPHDLSLDQKSFLVRTCFLNGALRNDTRECFKCFVESRPTETFVWSEYDNTPLGELYWIAEHLYQLDVLDRSDNGYLVNKNYVETIATFLSEPKGWTEKQLEEWLKEKKEIGNFAEEKIKEFEELRLKSLDNIVESHTVRFVGKLKVDAGYDIESFNGKSRNMNYDRFIEVKGSKGSNLRFIWSAKEIEVAKKLQDKYWIYFQGGIDMKNKRVKNKPLMFQDPYKLFFVEKKYPANAHGYIIEGNISGDLITL
jgi:hypothetical protein